MILAGSYLLPARYANIFTLTTLICISGVKLTPATFLFVCYIFREIFHHLVNICGLNRYGLHSICLKTVGGRIPSSKFGVGEVNVLCSGHSLPINLQTDIRNIFYM